MNKLLSALAFVLAASAVVIVLFHQNVALGATSQQVTDGTCLITPGGAHICTYRIPMRNASSTCSFRNPSSASSTFEGRATITNSYGASYGVGWGTDPVSSYASTTSLGYKQAAITSGSQGTFFSSSTSVLIASTLNFVDPASLVPPHGYANFKVGSSSPIVSGYCVGTYTY